jgi:diguanylate cyclase (GGDEF)-like protein
MLLFFVIIVVIPMIAVALVLTRLIGESEVGRADSQLAEGLQVAIGVYEDARRDAVDDLRDFSRQDAVRQAFVDDRRGALAAAARAEARRDTTVDSILLYDQDGERIVGAGDPSGVAYATATPTAPGGRRIGRIALSTTTASDYAQEVSRLTSLGARVVRDQERIASTLDEQGAPDPLATNIEGGDGEFRGRYTEVRDTVGAPVQVGIFQDADAVSGSITEDRALVIAILLGFFLLAIASSVLVVRSLGSQIDRFLGVARRVGRGDFAARVPAQGGDEFAALGREFNLMSEQLKESVDELEQRRREREEAIRTIGDAFATGLDRTGISRLAARSAIEACSAEAGRATPGGLEATEPVVVGSLDSQLEASLAEAEAAARDAPERTATASNGGAHALASALRGAPQAEGRRQLLGFLAIARTDEEFDDAEKDLFAYLAAQASVSLDNASLHETVQAQAVTDPLTGLSNRREFDTALEAEIGRSRRFGSEVGLVMMDLDGFKSINDLYGHQEGDRVLVDVANLLRRLTRDVDRLARFGGDEIAIILPQTDLGGAELLAERVRAGVEGLAIHPAGAGAPLTVTGSFGAAAIPETASDLHGLVGSADAALYRAKRAGGNRVARADPVALPR